MREIKFRQRNINNDSWHYWGNIDSYWVKPLISANYQSPKESNQFVGLHDKNGKEIYESDIILHEDEFRNEITISKFIVKFNNGSFYLESIEDAEYNAELSIKPIEIIGNIYEHKHLLNNNPELLKN